jgi:hypothetical protein
MFRVKLSAAEEKKRAWSQALRKAETDLPLRGRPTI